MLADVVTSHFVRTSIQPVELAWVDVFVGANPFFSGPHCFSFCYLFTYVYVSQTLTEMTGQYRGASAGMCTHTYDCRNVDLQKQEFF